MPADTNLGGRYQADAFCANCCFLGPVRPKVGQRIVGELCPVCRTESLMPITTSTAALYMERLEAQEATRDDC